MSKFFGTALCTVALAVVAAPAQASVTIDSGTTVSTTAITGPATSFSFGFAGTGTDSPFTQYLKWTNTLDAFTQISLTGVGDINITNVLLTGTGLGAGVGLPQLTNDPDTFSIKTGLGAGSYTLAIGGTRGTSGSFGGNVSATALPEASTWAMMLLGLGGIGWALRRKRQEASTTARIQFA